MANGVWLAPAKLNLFLHIIGRRADGYHELQTLFQFLDYCDRIEIEVGAGTSIRRVNEVRGVDEADDLCIRAANLLKEFTGVSKGADISIDKVLPMGGGLGGGSSDAATVLVGLNHLWGLDLGAEELSRLGLRLGADVPVFVRGNAAWAEGVGERLEPVEVPQLWYLVLVPPVHVGTAEIFATPELTRDTKPIRIAAFLSGAGRNDCESVVRSRYPQVAEALDWLAQFGNSRLTGTGGCVFASFESKDEAQVVKNQMPEGWIGFVAQGRNRSPLYTE